MNDNIQLFKANEVLQFKYISVPKELFVNPKYSHLSSDSKLLYGFILDRFHLSIQNNWKDENDNIYLIYARKDIQKLFHLSDKTVTKAFKEDYKKEIGAKEKSQELIMDNKKKKARNR